ncbi:Ig-like domain repeat protein [Cohnella abietis]|uniref:SLH domain-containing protein n=1 Tax=Cohnella abietis TaxID=2507935 RepID=A0A3T1D1F6_9BACL|nr:Ig-like domain repeat protein [Cohnella abietis]BBI31924.1 hypothetical protein KCTCHS21_13230 [Cohnella abietis]
MKEKIQNVFLNSWIRVATIALFITLIGWSAASADSTIQTTTTLTGAAQSTYGDSVTINAVVSDDTENTYNVPEGIVDFYAGNDLVGSTELFENLPVIKERPSKSAPQIPDAKLTCGSECPTIEWGGLTYWAYSYSINNEFTLLVAVDAHNNIVKKWEKVDSKPVRYVNQIELDPANRTVTFTGQGGTFTLSWAFLSHANAQASITLPELPKGVYDLKAVYRAGEGSPHSGSTSTGIIHTVGGLNSQTNLSSNSVTVEYGEEVIFTANVAGSVTGQPKPTGTVTFMDGADILDTVTLGGNGIAKLAKSDLPLGTHLITAVYSGDDKIYNTSNSSSLTQYVVAIKTKATLTYTPAAPKYGDKLTLQAKVANQSNNQHLPNGGKVIFLDGSTELGDATVLNGEASLEISTLGAGEHSLHVIYNAQPGDLFHSNSTSVDYEVTVGKASSHSNLSSDSATVEYGEEVTFTANVAGSVTGQPKPTGTVTFMDGADILDTVTLGGNGIAKLAKSDLPLGTHLITAVYSGDDKIYNTSNSSSLTQYVVAIKTKATLTYTPAAPKYGDKLTLQAKVANQSNNQHLPNGGKVIFLNRSTELGEATILNGEASLEISTLGAGEHSLHVIYNAQPGDLFHSNSTSVDYEVTVGKASSHSNLSSDSATVEYGEEVTFTANVTDSVAGQSKPTGTVTFKNGTDILGTATLDVDGKAKLVNSDLPLGTHLITAFYNGDDNYNTSNSSSLTQAVEAIKTKATLTYSPAAPKYGDKLKLIAKVANQSNNQHLPDGGKVVFMDGSTELGGATVLNGEAFLETSTLEVGEHKLRVIYNAEPGDSIHSNSTSVDYEVTIVNDSSNSNVSPPTTSIPPVASDNIVGSDGKANADLLIAALKANPNAIIHTASETVYLPANALSSSHALSIYNDTGVSITLPLSTLKLEELTQALGVDVKDLVIRVEMKKQTGEAASTVSNAISDIGANQLADAIDFRVVATAGDKEIVISNFGQLISRTIPLSSEVTAMATAVLYDPVEDKLSFVPSTFTVKDNITTVTLKRDGTSIYTVIQRKPTEFNDMQQHWAKNDVATLSSKLIVEGTENNLFEPSRQITRAEFAALIIRSLGIQPISSPTNTFNDVLSSKWYSGTIAAITKTGLMQGDEKGNFKPDSPITRKEMVAIVVRAMGYAGKSIKLSTAAEADAALAGFTDRADLQWAKVEFASAVKAGLIQGQTATKLEGNAIASRAEAAALIARYLINAGLIN